MFSPQPKAHSPSKRRPPSKKHRGAGTPRELWGEKLNEEYENYRRALLMSQRKEIWLSWTKKERGLVYVVSRTAHKVEQKRWRAELGGSPGPQRRCPTQSQASSLLSQDESLPQASEEEGFHASRSGGFDDPVKREAQAKGPTSPSCPSLAGKSGTTSYDDLHEMQ